MENGHWSQILGHQRILDVLSRAVDSGRLHHAYLFCGPPGVGKHTTAHALASVLNCRERPEDSFQPDCGECSACRRIADRQHPDVLFVEPPNQVIKIEQIRDIRDASVSAPYEARFRAVLIDDAHAMTEEAANALLKTLEEPPDRMILFVVTDQPHRLLDTIISRCQMIRFGALDDEDVERALAAHIEDSDVDERLLSIAAGFGEGSLGRSISMVESRALRERTDFLEDVFSLDERRAGDWLDLGESLGDREDEELHHHIDVLTVFFRDLMLYKRTDGSRVVNADLDELLAEQADRFSLEAILSILESLLSARKKLRGHVNSQLVAEDLLDRIRRPSHRVYDAPI